MKYKSYAFYDIKLLCFIIFVFFIAELYELIKLRAGVLNFKLQSAIKYEINYTVWRLPSPSSNYNNTIYSTIRRYAIQYKFKFHYSFYNIMF